MENLGLKKEIQNLTRKVAGGFDEKAQSKESNEPLELDDQNQDEVNVQEHANDSNWGDNITDESNNEPKKAAGFDEEAVSKDPQPKESNEPQELEDQNQDELNVQEHANDSDWGDNITDE